MRSSAKAAGSSAAISKIAKSGESYGGQYAGMAEYEMQAAYRRNNRKQQWRRKAGGRRKAGNGEIEESEGGK